MKKFALVLVLLTGMVSLSNAQELGFRFGDVTGGNVAIDAMFSTGEFNRIHADLSFGKGVGIDVLWDFLYMPIGKESFDWYLGAGPYMFLGSPFQFGIAGEIGLEYRFNSVPIALGVDWRPLFRIVDNTDFVFSSFGVNARWIFGKK